MEDQRKANALVAMPSQVAQILKDARDGLGAGSRSMSDIDTQLEIGGALLDHIEEKLELLFVAPQHPAPSPDADAARDAARYRWLRDSAMNHPEDDTPWCVHWEVQASGSDQKRPIDGAELDAAIDAAAQSPRQEPA